jgi:hypothetical protein
MQSRTLYVIRVIPLLALLLLQADALHAQGFRRELPEPARPEWLRTDTLLQQKVEANFTFAPLRRILASLSQQTGVSLHAEAGLGEYRLSLYAKETPLANLIGRVLDLFGHGVLPNDGYVWERRQTNEGNFSYRLIRLRKALIEEASLLDLPRKNALRWLRQLHEFASLSPEQQKEFKTDCPAILACQRAGQELYHGPNAPLREVVAALSTSQLETLADKGSVTLPAFAFSAEAKKYLEEMPPPDDERLKKQHLNNANAPGITLSFQPEIDSDLSGVFLLHLSPHGNLHWPYAFPFDTLRQAAWATDTDELQLPPPEKQKPLIRLPRKASDAVSTILSFEQIIALIAREAQLTLYAELFPRRPITLPALQGTPEELLTQVCAIAGYRWRKIGDDYLIYSKAWAQDRSANVPQSLIDPLLSGQKKSNRVTLMGLMEIASLKKEQIAALPYFFDRVQGPLFHPRLSPCLRLLKALPPYEVQRAYQSPDFRITFSNGAAEEIARRELGSRAVPPFHVTIQRAPARRFVDEKGQPVEIHGVEVLLRDRLGLSRRYGILEPFLVPRT